MTDYEEHVVLKLKDFIYRVNNKYKLEITNSKFLKDILNLIERQQKLIEECDSGDVITENQMRYIEDNYIRKDKIREKIKDLKNNLKSKEEQNEYFETLAKIEILEEISRW